MLYGHPEFGNTHTVAPPYRAGATAEHQKDYDMTTQPIAPSELADMNPRQPSEDGILRVAASSNPQQLASAIAHAVYAGQAPKLRAVGAGAVNQAVKACAIAAGYVAPTGRILSFRPGFENITSHDGQISSVTLQVIVG